LLNGSDYYFYDSFPMADGWSMAGRWLPDFGRARI
jgi:hypothetical protein